jgi:plasmid replication initiation protein
MAEVIENAEFVHKDSDVLIPDKYRQLDLFTCDIADAVLKDIVPGMEHPFYSLSKKPDLGVREYYNGDNWLKVTPSVKGHATVYDKDILIFAISNLMATLNENKKISKRIRIHAHEFLKFSNRGTGGKDYRAFVEALDRLGGVRISTNISTPEGQTTEFFGLVDAASIRREFGLDGRIQWIEVALSDWVFDAIRAKSILTLHPDYFRLRKPLERRVYELARKHCGHKRKFVIGIDKLLNKSGAKTHKDLFKHKLVAMAKTDHIPDYSIAIDGQNVIFTSKGTVKERETVKLPALDPEVYNKARKVAGGWDLRRIEQEWRADSKKKGLPVRNPEAAYIGFVKKWVYLRGSA